MKERKKKTKVDYKKNLLEYWSYIKDRKLIISGIVFFSVLTQLILVAEKYLFKEIIDAIEAYVKKDILLNSLITTFLIIGGIFIAFLIVRTINVYGEFILMGKLQTRLTQKIKVKYFSHIVKLHHKFHTSHKTGSLISRLGRATGAASSLTESIIFDFAPLIIQLAILIPAFIGFGFSQALILFFTCLIFLIYAYYGNVHVAEKYRTDENTAHDLEKATFSDVFTNVDSVKYFGKENLVVKRFQKITDNTAKFEYAHWKWWGNHISGKEMIIGIGTLLLFGFSLKQFIEGTLTLGEFTFIYTTFMGILGPLNWFSWGIRRFTQSLTDVQDLFEYGEVSNEIKDKKGAKNLIIKKGEIEFRNVSFDYDKKNKLFSDFNLKIPKNKTVALVGHSGCGKTSIVKLLYRLYDVGEGQILIDGKDIRDVKQESLRSEMAIVPQEAILFDDSIYNNIKFTKPDATRAEVMRAIKFAQLDKFIKNLPKGVNTVVGERGVKLSGGQKQRVSIARALLADKKVLVLDEATSALDSRTENEIQKDLERLMKGRTSIVIAHRLSTVMKADIIVVMDNGKITQMGTHRDLITEGGEYANLWNFQKGGFIQD